MTTNINVRPYKATDNFVLLNDDGFPMLSDGNGNYVASTWEMFEEGAQLGTHNQLVIVNAQGAEVNETVVISSLWQETDAENEYWDMAGATPSILTVADNAFAATLAPSAVPAAAATEEPTPATVIPSQEEEGTPNPVPSTSEQPVAGAHTVYKDTTADELIAAPYATYFVGENYEHDSVNAALAQAGLGEFVNVGSPTTEEIAYSYSGMPLDNGTFLITGRYNETNRTWENISPQRIAPAWSESGFPGDVTSLPAVQNPITPVIPSSTEDWDNIYGFSRTTQVYDQKFVLNEGVTLADMRAVILSATNDLVQAVEANSNNNIGFIANITEVNKEHSGYVGIDPEEMFIKDHAGNPLRNPWPVEADQAENRGYYLRTWDADVAKALVTNLAPRAQAYGELSFATTVPSQQLSTDIVGQNQNGEITDLQTKGYITEDSFNAYLETIEGTPAHTALTTLGYAGAVAAFNPSFSNDAPNGVYLRGYLDAVVPHPLAAYRGEMPGFLLASFDNPNTPAREVDPALVQAAIDRYNAAYPENPLALNGQQAVATLNDANTPIVQGSALDEFLTFAHTEHVAAFTARQIQVASSASTQIGDDIVHGNPDVKVTIVSDILLSLPANSLARTQLLASLPEGTVIQVENLYNVVGGQIVRDDALFAQIEAIRNDPTLQGKNISFQLLEYFGSSAPEASVNLVGETALAAGFVPVFGFDPDDIVAGSVAQQDGLNEWQSALIDPRTVNFYANQTHLDRARALQPDWLNTAEQSSNVTTAAVVEPTLTASNDVGADFVNVVNRMYNTLIGGEYAGDNNRVAANREDQLERA